jgi:predicted alpha-1,2-mannosidase
MGGDSPAILLSEARAFGARDFDLKTALKFALQGATKPGQGPHHNFERPGLEPYLTKGYVPVSNDQEGAASISLEYNNADFAVARFASAMGDESDAERLFRSAQNWRTLFDRNGGWIRPRAADGNFLDRNWDPDRLTPHHKKRDTSNQMGFEEGSTWQYTFMIPYNYAGLFRAMGGEEQVIPRLDKFFEKLSGWALPNFTVTNEPDFCVPYAYLWTSRPWKTAAVIDRIRKQTFTTKPGGLPGNDDLGATSGVYVWSAIGIYPEIPGLGGFTIGTPMFRRVTMSLGKGKTLKISATGDGIYVRAVRINGTSHASSWINLSELALTENQIAFELEKEPNAGWAIKPSERPPSLDVKKP